MLSKHEFGVLPDLEEYIETLLWENNSPTSDFASQTITLPDNISNYDYIRIDWEYAKTVTDKKSSVIIPVVDFITSGGASNTYTHYFIGYVGTVTAVRCVSYVSDNQIAFSGDMRVNAAASYTNTDIPLKVIGLKKERTNIRKITLDQLLYNSNKTLLGSITTYNGSYTATEDCVMYGYGKCASGSSASPTVTLNDMLLVFGNGTANQFYVGYNSSSDTSPSTYGIFIPKDTTVKTRDQSGQTYKLEFYTLK